MSMRGRVDRLGAFIEVARRAPLLAKASALEQALDEALLLLREIVDVLEVDEDGEGEGGGGVV